jgi:glycerate 2-kinase
VPTLLAAPDKFRGSASAPDVAAAIAAAAAQMGWSCVQMPLADGGEGTLDAFGGANRTTTVTGPLGRPVDAPWRMGDDGVAVVESARASGLVLAGGAEGNDPIGATSRGTGELVAAAIAEGARRVIVSLGGSATTDGGFDTVEVLEGYAPFDGRDGRPDVLVACDVRTTFRDAAVVFGPQKGATPEEVEELERRLAAMDELRDVAELPGAGAAGGLGAALASLGAELRSGVDLVLEAVGFDGTAREADVVVTGEGTVDRSSAEGKVPAGVARACARAGLPCVVFGGRVEQGAASDLHAVGATAILSLGGRPEQARADLDGLGEALGRLVGRLTD